MSPTAAPGGWLLLVHQIPARPTRLRVSIWRRLRDVGAVAFKHSVYLLPNTPQSREDFEWIKTEILEMRGEAAVFEAQIDAFTHDDVVALFRRVRAADYTSLAADADALAAALRKPPALSRKERSRRATQLRQRLASLDAIAFFPPDNRDTVAARVARAVQLVEPPGPPSTGPTDCLEISAFQKCLWVTRPRPGIDRLASAWLIRRFIDPKARFSFIDTPPSGRKVVPFDMFGVPFSHTAAGCTFETLVARFQLTSPAVDRIAAIAHDLDLKDGRFSPPEAPALARLVDGLTALYTDDQTVLAQGLILFEALYRSFATTQTGDSTARTRRLRPTKRA